jgi:hypothetical protein
MDRSLRALLSPDEEATLRRISIGGVHPMSLRERDVMRLKGLGLIDQTRMGLSITSLGLQRLGRPPTANPSADRSGDPWPEHFPLGRFLN